MFAGFDSAEYRKQFILREKPHVTRGLVGIGVRAENLRAFSKSYKSALSAVFEKYKAKQARSAYCAAELSAIFGAQSIDKEQEVLELFLKGALPAIDQLHFFYSYLFHLDHVTIFGDDPDGHEQIPVASWEKGVMDFYDLISPSYTMLCAWKYQRVEPKDHLLLDQFQGKVSPAWTEFVTHEKSSVYYNGDRCNPLISTADLICRLVKVRMLAQNCRFLEPQMNALMPETSKKLTKHFLGSIYLKKMVPHKRTRVDGSKLAKHPITFIIREQPEDEKELEMVQSTPAFNNLLEEAYQKDGSLKFFDPSGDTRQLTKEDTLFTYGERGEKIAKNLKKLGVEFHHEHNNTV